VSDAEPSWRGSRVKRAQAAAIAAVGYPLIAALGSTLRYIVEGAEHLNAPRAAGHPLIYGFWHGRILPGAYYFRRRGIVVITSSNFDGEWIARIISRLGYGTARGSSSRRSRAAMLQMIREVRAGRPTAFTLDGPRGPARAAKPGAVFLARATGAPILPFHLEADRFWELRSWDRTQIPKPFARIALVIGEPLYVPADADAAAVEAHRATLHAVLERLERRALALVGREA
jgi:lysophospholipid acyltransferase (LPLAT)-like uncharacterized protein